jgi:hypothetical protein
MVAPWQPRRPRWTRLELATAHSSIRLELATAHDSTRFLNQNDAAVRGVLTRWSKQLKKVPRRLVVAVGFGFLPGSVRGGSKGPSVTQKLCAAAVAAPRTRGILQLWRESVDDWSLSALGLWVLQVEIRVDGAPFYRGFLPKSWPARTPFHFILNRNLTREYSA